MSDYIIVPRIPDSDQIRRAARNLLHREPNDTEYEHLHRAYTDMTSGLPDCGLCIVEKFTSPALPGARLIDPDAALHKLSE